MGTIITDFPIWSQQDYKNINRTLLYGKTRLIDCEFRIND